MATQSGSPRSPRVSKSLDEEVVQPGTIKISVRYAETGDSQVLYFPSTSTVEELKRQVMEYAEHGVNCKMSSMILLLDNGTSLVKTSALLANLSSFKVFMFSRETLLKTYIPTVALEDFKLDFDPDSELKRELCERCLSRCKAQIEAGEVALLNLEEHAKFTSNSLQRFQNAAYLTYLQKASVLRTFDQDMEKLGQVQLARSVNRMTASTSLEKRTMLDALPKDKIRKLSEEASRQHEVIEQKVNELLALARVIDEGCEQVRSDWKTTSMQNNLTATRIEEMLHSTPDLDKIVNDLKMFKAQTTKALFPTLLRVISSLQSRIQDVSNRLAALKEALVVQEQKLSQISVIRSIPDAYQAALKEADRRRLFISSYSDKITQLTDYVAKERDQELERREQFNRTYGKILLPDLVPGLVPWVFPACEVTQRQIDPLLVANVLQYSTSDTQTTIATTEPDNGELLFEADSAGPEKELSAMDILELQAENESLKTKLGMSSSESAMSKVKVQYEKEKESLRVRVAELEARLSSTTRGEEEETKQSEVTSVSTPDYNSNEQASLNSPAPTQIQSGDENTSGSTPDTSPSPSGIQGVLSSGSAIIRSAEEGESPVDPQGALTSGSAIIKSAEEGERSSPSPVEQQSSIQSTENVEAAVEKPVEKEDSVEQKEVTESTEEQVVAEEEGVSETAFVEDVE